MDAKEISLYFHIPFCTRKCPYCHFYVIPDRAEHRALLLKSLLLEWERLTEKTSEYEIVSIYFGGGTPSLFGAEAVDTLLRKISSSASLTKDCEITLEMNPENVTHSLVNSYRAVGVNRVSLGVQSLVDDSLITIGRTHSSSGALFAIEQIQKAGIDNLSIDLMMELPSQTPESFQKTLDQLEKLPITHLSLYNLTIEPHTSFYKNRKNLSLPSAEEGLDMLKRATSHLEQIGLKRYEVSAFAKPGYFSRHNVGYWTARPFFGLGPSAFSYFAGKRFSNCANLNRYAKALRSGKSAIDFVEKLSYPQNVCELLAVELRLLKGVKMDKHDLPEKTKETLLLLTQEEYLEEKEGRLKLTEKGLLFYDFVASEIV
ncbi:MAG: Oxygen-independent coproporphyrinogen-III oxidase-like protein [Chlamydiae bacterium]|nr:Oxygen-independent coproporphyrinogen-III oxidase-like protein [Chlamydiota bacterium]